mgnify:FL=1
MSFIYENRKPPYKKVYFGINGQFGDIIMQIPALDQLIKDNPETKIVFGMSKKYEQILPLFKDYHPNIIDYKIWEGYDDWPTQSDLEYIKSQNFDAMFPCQIPKHDDPFFAKHRHINTETALMLGIETDIVDIKLPYPKDIIKEPKTVALHLFSSKWPGGIRSIDIAKQNFIVNYLRKRGYKIYQLSGPGQPHIKNTTFFRGTYFESCMKMLTTDFLVTCDSGMPWIASAYSHHMIGLYSWGYNHEIGTTKNRQPVNKNAIFVENFSANDIQISKIFKLIDKKIRETS